MLSIFPSLDSVFLLYRLRVFAFQMMVLARYAKDVVERSRCGLFLKFQVQLIFRHT